MTFLFGLIVPFIVAASPLVILLLTCGRTYFKKSFKLTISISLFSLLLGLITPFCATIVSANGLSYDLPKDRPNCVEGASVFFPLGYIFTIIAIGFAVNYCIKSYKYRVT